MSAKKGPMPDFQIVELDLDSCHFKGKKSVCVPECISKRLVSDLNSKSYLKHSLAYLDSCIKEIAAAAFQVAGGVDGIDVGKDKDLKKELLEYLTRKINEKYDEAQKAYDEYDEEMRDKE